MKKELTVTELASMGGKARFAKMSKEEKSALGRKAINIRWAKWREDAEKKRERAILEESK